MKCLSSQYSLDLCFYQAVCCSDMKHCCPENTKCDVSSGKCTRGDGLVLDWFEKMPLAVRSRGQGEASSVMCPDGASECEDGQTCCLLASGRYGCCPIQDVCIVFDFYLFCHIFHHIHHILVESLSSKSMYFLKLSLLQNPSKINGNF